MSKLLHNPHDKFVRETFSDPERARAFIEEFLPNEFVLNLDLPSLKVLKDSYLDKELKEYFSDLIFDLEIRGIKKEKLKIALLFEHKSAPDKFVLIQVGYYLFSHWFKQIRQRKKLDLVIPLIYYQGKQKWKVPDLLNHFKDYPEELKKYVPQLKHIFIALNEIPDSQLNAIRNTMLLAAITAQKFIKNPNTIIEDVKRIMNLFPPEDFNKNFLGKITVYILGITSLSEKQLAEALDSIPLTIKENVMSTYHRLINIGIEKGMEKGQNVMRKEMILALFDDGIGIGQIAKYAKISEEEVIKILTDNNRKV